jgi:hypothetical protein
MYKEQPGENMRAWHFLSIMLLGGCGNSDFIRSKKADLLQNNVTPDICITSPQLDECQSFSSEVFDQQLRNKADILWVIDNSGSMDEEQNNLATNFESFIGPFLDHDIDIQMAITTTDSQVVEDSLTDLTFENLMLDKQSFQDNFIQHVKVGIQGDGNERSFQGAIDFINEYGKSWLRDQAPLFIIFISDEQEQTSHSAKQFLDVLEVLTVDKLPVVAYSIYRTDEPSHKKFRDIAEITGGSYYDINSEFAPQLVNMGEKIIQKLDLFPLQHSPVVDSIQVLVDEALNNDWYFDEQFNGIRFLTGHEPGKNQKIKIKYKVKN